jgi:CheY-like chemotaxis protein
LNEDDSQIEVRIIPGQIFDLPFSHPCEQNRGEQSSLVLLAGREEISDLLGRHEPRERQQALEAARQLRPALVLADVMMPRLDGFELLRAIRDDPALCSTPVILVSARAGEESRDGREDLVSGTVRWTELRPAEWRERDESAMAVLKATSTVEAYEQEIFRKDGSRATVLAGGALFEEGGEEGVAFVLDLSEQKRAEAEIRALKNQLYFENLVLREEMDWTSMFEEIVGTSPALQPVLARVAKVARTGSTVLITGETCTGKELVARAIHRRSARVS